MVSQLLQRTGIDFEFTLLNIAERMSTRKLVTFITFLAIFAMAARISVDTDTWWHLRAGEWMLEHRQILQIDHFSYTRGGEPWQYPGWLVELPMIALYRLGGPGLLNLWTAATVTLAFVFIWLTLSGNAFLKAFSLILAATASAVYWAARPYLVTFVLAAIFLWLLEEFRWRGRDHLWWLPVLMIVWVNSHGGFIVGFLIWGVYAFYALLKWGFARWGASGSKPVDGKPLIRLLIIGGLMLIAVFVNPSGAAMYPYAFKTVNIGALQDYIQEWQSPNFHLLHVQPFAWLLLLTFGVVGASRRRLALTDFLLFSGFAYMGLMAGRNIALFALVAPIVLTRHADPFLAAIGRRFGLRQQIEAPPSRSITALNWVLLSLVFLAVLIKVATIYPESVNQGAFRENLPVGAVEYLNTAQLPGRIFNSYNWGGYLIWALPEYPVFIDGRTDLYNDEVIDEWLKVVRAEPGWQEALSRWDVGLILLEPDMVVSRLLEEDAEWKKVYQDGLSAIFARR